MISVGVTDPRILCEPFVGHAAEWTVCTAKKYRFAEERFTVHLDASGYFPLCDRATDLRWVVVNTAIVHVQAIDDGVTDRRAALNDPPAHGSYLVTEAARGNVACLQRLYYAGPGSNMA